ncbi:hypothetical protein Tco_1546498 [Tanacetum coccineum]
MESSSSNSEERELQQINTRPFEIAFRIFFHEEHQTFEEKTYHNLNQLQWQLERNNFHGRDSKTCLDNFKDSTGCEPETYKRNLLRYLTELDKLIDERVLKYGELWMKEREVQALKEIEQRLKESEMQTQESLVTEASLVTEGIALGASLVDKQCTFNSSTSLEQQHDYNSSRNEYSRLGNENESSDNERSSSGNDADVDIRPLNDSDTVFEVHNDMFKNMFLHEIQNHEQPKSIPNTYVTNENNSNIISDIPNMDPDRDKEEHNYVDDEQQRALFASLINNLNCDIEKCTKVNHEAQQANVLLTNELERYKEKEKHFSKDKIIESRNRMSDEFVIKDVNLQLNCFEKGIVKEMKDDLNHVYENEIFKQNSSLENENCCLKKTITELSKQPTDVKEEMTKRCAQYEKDFAKLKAHDEAKIKFDIEDPETINIELEYSVASLLKDFLQKSLYDSDPSNVESKSGKKIFFSEMKPQVSKKILRGSKGF